jgi:hypothetical protein
MTAADVLTVPGLLEQIRQDYKNHATNS